jgi:hypothetical protein
MAMRRVLTVLGPGADDLLEGVARLHQVGAQGVQRAVGLIAHHQPIVGIEEGKGVFEGVDGATQHRVDVPHLGFGLAALADVGVGEDRAATRHRGAADLQRLAVGPHKLKALHRRHVRLL